MSEENKRLVRRAYEDIRSQGDLDLADEIFARDYRGHDPTAEPPEVYGPEGFKQQTAAYRSVFPDLRFTIDSMVAEGDEVIVRWTAMGTHRGSLAGERPTGKNGYRDWLWQLGSARGQNHRALGRDRFDGSAATDRGAVLMGGTGLHVGRSMNLGAVV
jgi:predicted ester cyclase